MIQRNTHRRTKLIVAVAIILALVFGGVLAIRHMTSLPWQSIADAVTSRIAGTASGITSQDSDASTMPADEANQKYPKAVSPVDFNGNGVDDYADIVAGARKDAQAKPQYDDGYYQGGYPPDDRGACTDLVWRAFREAGYDLKAMVDADIAADPASYAAVAPNPDPNIDFRRTGVLDVFFAKYGQSLTTDPTDKASWQGGDIVVFNHTKHIGIISDKRDSNGITYVLHNMAQNNRENDYLAFAHHMNVTGHYRFDASKVPQQVLKVWQQ
ncbi:putative periplasmic protein [Bifidobacterium saguini DSM 23967]|nr:putative periplasmic protein [Bifidobacterium saguini DSM 23967]